MSNNCSFLIQRVSLVLPRVLQCRLVVINVTNKEVLACGDSRPGDTIFFRWDISRQIYGTLLERMLCLLLYWNCSTRLLWHLVLEGHTGHTFSRSRCRRCQVQPPPVRVCDELTSLQFISLICTHTLLSSGWFAERVFGGPNRSSTCWTGRNWYIVPSTTLWRTQLSWSLHMRTARSPAVWRMGTVWGCHRYNTTSVWILPKQPWQCQHGTAWYHLVGCWATLSNSRRMTVQFW